MRGAPVAENHLQSPFVPAHPRLREDRRGDPVAKHRSRQDWVPTFSRTRVYQSSANDGRPKSETSDFGWDERRMLLRLRSRILLSNSPVAFGSELRRVKRRSAPVLSLGQGGALRVVSLLPQKIEGDGAPQGAWPGLLQTGPRVSRLPGEPGSPGPGVKRHPRALRRANEHLRAYALPTVGPHQELFVPGGLFPRSPVGRVASALPAGALPLPALRTSPEDAPRRVDRDRLSIITLQVKSRTISLMVNNKAEQWPEPQKKPQAEARG